IAGVPVLIRGRLDERYRRQVPRIQRLPEVAELILAVRLVGAADLRDRRRREMIRVRRRSEVLERLMVRDVVLADDPRLVGMRLRAVPEASLEPGPADVLLV